MIVRLILEFFQSVDHFVLAVDARYLRDFRLLGRRRSVNLASHTGATRIIFKFNLFARIVFEFNMAEPPPLFIHYRF